MDGANISDLGWALKLLHLLESYVILRLKNTFIRHKFASTCGL